MSANEANTDLQLLANYTHDFAEDAFAELARRAPTCDCARYGSMLNRCVVAGEFLVVLDGSAHGAFLFRISSRSDCGRGYPP